MENKHLAALGVTRRRLIVNSVWLEIFVLSFLIGAFLANTGLDWLVGNAAFFVNLSFVYLGLVRKRCCFI